MRFGYGFLRSAWWPREGLAHVFAVAAVAFGEDPGGYRAVGAVLEGDGLHGGGGGAGEMGAAAVPQRTLRRWIVGG